MNRHFRIRQIIVFLTWLIPIAFSVLAGLLQKEEQYFVMNILLVILAINALYLVLFFLFVPYWLGLFFILLVMERKKRLNNEPFYNVVCIFLIVATLILVGLITACDLDHFCRTSDTPLTGESVIVFSYLSILFGTLPFALLSRKIIKRFRKA